MDFTWKSTTRKQEQCVDVIYNVCASYNIDNYFMLFKILHVYVIQQLQVPILITTHGQVHVCMLLLTLLM